MGFWTRVRLPSSPLKRNKSNGIVCCESDLQCRYFYDIMWAGIDRAKSEGYFLSEEPEDGHENM